MHVDPQSWPVLSRLMDEWLDLPEDQRDAWLASLEPQYAALLPSLRELLATPGTDFLSALPPIAPAAEPFVPGMLAGRYRLERELGRGGMGVVWLATRADGSLKRDVALKFPLTDLSGNLLQTRFARERDILARLEDARIARLYDAGVTAQGQPYLAMEYVDGEAITSHCDRLRLGIRPRLQVFLEVLQAVQYAHTNLVVHRDLKPSNILVTNAGQVRLLDFGIAKLLDESERSGSEITRVGGCALTPGYASPEQSRGDALSTATDVYSLGVLLHELLTGHRPDAPSAIDGPIAQARGGATPKSLAAALRGDLDTITRKAIQNDPPLRYLTADAFRQDVERYLNGEPVLARPVSRWYKARKFVLRNKLAAAAATIGFIALVAGVGVAFWQAHRALQEKHRADTEAATARAVSDFLQKDLLSQAGSSTQAGSGARPDPDMKVRVALDRAAARISGKFQSQPAVEAAIRQTIGETYWELSLYPEAEQQMNRALELRRSSLGGEHLDTLATMEALSEVYRKEGKFDAAEALLNQLLEIERGLGRGDSLEAIGAMHTLASLANDKHADAARAEKLYVEVLAIERRVLGDTHQITLSTMNNLAAVLARERKFQQAEELYRKLLELKSRTFGADHPSTLTSMNGLGVLYRNEGKYAEAEVTLKEALERRLRAMGEQHRDTLASMNGLGLLYSIEAKYSDAEPLLTHTAEKLAQVLGQDNPDTQSALNNLAELYRKEMKLKESESAYQRLLESRQKVYGPDNAFTAATSLSLGEVKLQRHAYAQASPLLQSGLDYRLKHQPDNWGRYYAECLLAASLSAEGKRDKAKPLLASGCPGLATHLQSVPKENRLIVDQALPSK